MKFLYAAYTVTWVVLIFYLVYLTRGFQRLRDDLDELRKNSR